MTFTSLHIQFLQRLVRERPNERRAGKIALYLCEHHSIGAVVGDRIAYRDHHHRLAESFLRANDLPIHRAEEATRADVAQFGGLSEKILSSAPHANSVAVRCIGNCTLDSSPLTTPAGSYLVVTPQTARAIACERLMLVENLEPFRQLERYRWIDYQDLSILAVYRGDSVLSPHAALTVIRERDEPIWAFVDFDPAGLLIANSLPADRLEHVMLPDIEWLREAARTTRGRELFDLQEVHARRSLDGAVNPAVQLAWKELCFMRSGVIQERMASA